MHHVAIDPGIKELMIHLIQDCNHYQTPNAMIW